MVVLHSEALRYISKLLGKLRLPGRLPVLLSVPGVLAAHTIEVWVFAASYFLQVHAFNMGTLIGSDGTFWDCVYFSFVTYT